MLAIASSLSIGWVSQFRLMMGLSSMLDEFMLTEPRLRGAVRPVTKEP